jgi:hypothetical protein
MTASKTMQATVRKDALPKFAKDWTPFRGRLSKILLALEEDQFLIISVKRANRFVQFSGQGSFGMRVETISNRYLPDGERLNRKQMSALRKIGWKVPTGSAQQSTPESDPDGSPNYHVDFPVPVPVDQIAELTIATFAEIHGVAYPGNLDYEAFDDEGNPLDLSELGLKRRAQNLIKDAAANKDALKMRLRTTLRALTGIDELDFDDDGDIGVRCGSVIAFARLVEEGPTVQVFAPLVQKISTNPAVMEKLNDMNAKNLRMRLFVLDDTVYGVADIPVEPYVENLVAREFDHFCKTADDLDNLLQGEFGGRTAFYEWIPSVSRH